MYHILFIHSSMHRHLSSFYVLAMVNSAAMNIGVHASFRNMVFSKYMPGLYFLKHKLGKFCKVDQVDGSG